MYLTLTQILRHFVSKELTEERWKQMRDRDELTCVTSLFWNFIPYHALRVAISAGLFDELERQDEISSSELADRMGWKLRPAERLFEILEIIGLTRKTAGGITLSDQSRHWLVKASPTYIGSYLKRTSLLEDAYQNLEHCLRTDMPDVPLQAATQKAFGLSADANLGDIIEFGEILSATSTPVAKSFFEIATIPATASVLDVGAGTGIFTKMLLDQGHIGSVHFLDTPLVCDVVRPLLAEYESKISWLPVDWNHWRHSQSHDVIFLHHALHEEKVVDAERLFSECARSLNRNGIMYVIGIFEAGIEDKNNLAQYFGMNIVLETGGDNTSLEGLRSLARRLSLQECMLKPLPGGRTLWAARQSG